MNFILHPVKAKPVEKPATAQVIIIEIDESLI
jgi:hypothetical protein